MSMRPLSECGRCTLYDELRGPRIRAEIAKTHKGRSAKRRYAQFLRDYHELHVTAGRFAALVSIIQEHEELDTRPN